MTSNGPQTATDTDSECGNLKLGASLTNSDQRINQRQRG